MGSAMLKDAMPRMSSGRHVVAALQQLEHLLLELETIDPFCGAPRCCR
jgi:hypothetical protein